eukprot:SAG11_NODE_2253_length_3630_cov_9.405551_6_plen_168_part_00
MRAAGGARQAVHDLRRLKCDAGSGVDAQLIALELMKGSSRHIMDKANKYKRVGAEKKKQSIMAKHKFAWQKESKQLDAERRALERDLWEVEVPGVFDLAQLERERSELSLETEALGDSIWNDYQVTIWLDIISCARIIYAFGAFTPSNPRRIAGDRGACGLHQAAPR